MSAIDDQNALTVRDKMSILVEIKDGSRTYTFTEADIVSCELSLRANLEQYKPTLPVSTITLEIYSAQDLSDTVANMGNNIPITYSAGYPGDMSPTRTFFLSGRATYDRHILSLTGEDQVAKLDAVQFDERLLPYYYNSMGTGSGRYTIWADAKSILTEAGVTLLDEDAAPPTTSSEARHYAVLYAGSGRDTLARYMAGRLIGSGYQYSTPVFGFRYVDAGRPTLRWLVPTVKGTIDISNLGDLHTSKTRGYAGVRFTDTGRTYYYPRYTRASTSDTLISAYNQSVGADQIIKLEAPNSIPYYDYRHSVASGTTSVTYISKQPRAVTLKSANACTLNVYGRPLGLETNPPIISPRGSGSGTLDIDPLCYGGVYEMIGTSGPDACFWPIYTPGLISRKRIECTWRGDPRLQPRDVINIRRSRTDTRSYTIESIHTTHRGGGMTQELVLYEGLL